MSWVQIVQTVGSIATPLIVLILGLLINRQLERSKLSLSKEKEWQTKWADGFFSRVIAFNDAVEKWVLLLWEFGQLSHQSSEESSKKLKTKNEQIALATEMLIRSEWLLKSHVQFAPHHGDDVLKSAEAVMTLVRNMRDKRHGDLDEIRSALTKFNVAAKNAHHEMLVP